MTSGRYLLSFLKGRYIENVKRRIGKNGFPLWLFQTNSHIYMHIWPKVIMRLKLKCVFLYLTIKMRDEWQNCSVPKLNCHRGSILNCAEESIPEDIEKNAGELLIYSVLKSINRLCFRIIKTDCLFKIMYHIFLFLVEYWVIKKIWWQTCLLNFQL